MRRFLRNSRGMALLLTILVITLIVSLTLQFNRSMRSDLYAAANLRDSIKLSYVAKSGFDFARAVLREDDTEVDSLHDTWANLKTYSAYSAALFDEGRFEVKVSDHSGRIQINQLVDQSSGNYDENQRKLLTRFLKSPKFGLEDEKVSNIVDAVKDWIDDDNDVTRFGAENAYYQTLEKPYKCKNAPIEFLEDLLLVKGITKELFYGTREKPGGISKYLTPYGEDGKININTVDPVVFKALSEEINDDMVENMVDYRKNEDNDLGDVNWEPRVGTNIVPEPQGLLTTSSTYFEVTSKGFEGSMAKLVTGTVKRTGQGIKILSWKTE